MQANHDKHFSESCITVHTVTNKMGMTDKFPDQQIKKVHTELCESIDACKV